MGVGVFSSQVQEVRSEAKHLTGKLVAVLSQGFY